MQSFRGWPLFVVGILISIFLGGALRVSFSPSQVRTWVEDQVVKRQPKINLEFDEAKLTLASGYFPQLAIEFKNLKITAKDSCLTLSDIFMTRLNVPISIGSFGRKGLKIGTPVIEDAKFRFRPGQCGVAMNKNSKQSFKDYLSARWARELKNTRKIIDGFYISNIKVYDGDSVDPIFEFQDFEFWLDLKQEQLKFSGGALPGYVLTGGEPLGSFRGKGSIGVKDILIEGQGNLKEGQYHFSINWDVIKEKFSSKLSLVDVPMKNAVALLDRWGFLRWQGFRPRHQWFSCELSTSGSSAEWRSASTLVEDCRFYGDLGRWKVRGGKMRLLAGELFPLMVDVQGMPLKAFLQAQNLEQYMQYLVKAGELDFHFEFLGKDYFQLQGLWKTPIFQYNWNPEDSAVFPVNQLKLGVQRTQEIFAVSLNDIIWDDGNVEGVINLENNRLNGDWLLRWNAFVPTVPGLLLRTLTANKIKDLKSDGELTWHDEDQVTSGTFNANATAVEMRGLSSGSLSGKFKMKKGKGAYRFDVQNLASVDSKAWAPWMKLLSVEKLEFSSVASSGSFETGGNWQVDQLTAKGNPSSVNFKGRGFKGGIDEGLVSERPNNKAPGKKWQAFGTLLEPRFESSN